MVNCCVVSCKSDSKKETRIINGLGFHSIAASKAATSWEPAPAPAPAPARSVADDGVSSTTASGFISLKVERKRTHSASSGEVKPSRKRTSSGLFVVDDASKKEPPEHGVKIERLEFHKNQASEGNIQQKERKDSKERKKKEIVSNKKQKTEFEITETNVKCVTAFQESDNWD